MGLKGLGELAQVGGNGGVGQSENFRRAAVVGLDLEDLGAGMVLGEFQDVGEISTPPGVDALGVVSDGHEVSVPQGQAVEQRCLKDVGVLVLVHQHELKASLVGLGDVGEVLKESQPEHQQVIKVHEPGLALALGVLALDEPNGIHHPGKRAFFTAGHFLQGLTGIDLHGEEVRQRLGLRKTDGLHVDGRVGDARVEQILGVLAVGNGEVATVAESVGVQSQDADPD